MLAALDNHLAQAVPRLAPHSSLPLIYLKDIIYLSRARERRGWLAAPNAGSALARREQSRRKLCGRE